MPSLALLVGTFDVTSTIVSVTFGHSGLEDADYYRHGVREYGVVGTFDVASTIIGVFLGLSGL